MKPLYVIVVVSAAGELPPEAYGGTHRTPPKVFGNSKGQPFKSKEDAQRALTMRPSIQSEWTFIAEISK
jgi:hypothetical protein